MKNLHNFHFAVLIERREGSYLAYCPQFEEAGHVDGADLEEVMAVMKSAIRIVVKEKLEAGEEIPQAEPPWLTCFTVETEQDQNIS